MLHKAGLFNSPVKRQHPIPTFSDEEDEEDAADVEMSLVRSFLLLLMNRFH